MTHTYNPPGYLAIAPHAFGAAVPDLPKAKIRRHDGVAVVSIRGPLVQHAEDCGPWDSYEEIRARVGEALEGNPRGVVLRLDSPGGLVAGCFDTARAIRELATAAGVPLVAFVDSEATSAAYALACVCDSIVVSSTGSVGSIGVMGALVDTTAADAAMGVRFALIGSGARKLDSNPHAVLTEDAVAAAQSTINGLARVFFDHVSAHRPALPSEAIEGLQAGVFFGAGAVGLGLADSVGTLEDAIAATAGATQPNTTEDAMASNFEEALASLSKAAEGDDEEAARARRMLAAADDNEEPEAAEGEDDSEEEDEPTPPAAESDEDEEDDKMKAMATRVIRAEKRALLATRPDVSDEMRAAVMSADVSPEAAEKILAATPRATPVRPVVDAAPAATRGGKAEGAPSSLTPAAAAMDRAFGLTPVVGGVTRDGTVTTFSVGKAG